MKQFENLETETKWNLETKDTEKKLAEYDDEENLKILKQLSLDWETYVYIKYLAKYLWVEKRKFFNWSEVVNNLMLNPAYLKKFRLSLDIKTFNDLTYYAWWKYKSYNQLDESLILQPSNNPILHDDIKELIDNIWWNKEENIKYLHEIILYKYNNLNDYTIPWVILFWVWGSWKWTLMNLFKTIYWSINVLDNLWQRDLTSSFDTYKWCALIIEFAEVITNNTAIDKRILNKLKNLIWAKKITINEKWIQAYQIENIAQVFISSNSNIPIQLDDKEKWNRRFTVIKSISKLKDWTKTNKAVEDKNIISDYLAWLHDNFKYVLDYKSIPSLNNEDKKELEELTREEANKFWEWLEYNYPDYTWNKSISDIWLMLDEYCLVNAIEPKEFYRYFWKHSKYIKKRIRIWIDLSYWVCIPKPETVTIEEVTEIFKL